MRTLHKPAGLTVFPPHDQPDGDCLLARLLVDDPARASLAWPAGFEGGISHRLDNSTSGAVLVADSPEELVVIRTAFASGQLRKTYRLRARRVAPWTTNTCDAPIAHDPRHKRRMVVQRGANTPHRGRWLPAHTAFRHRHDDVYEAVITTGVMHQIRVHAAFVGIPLLGDALYGGGQPPPDAPPGLTFFLHHEGLVGPDVRTDPVPGPGW